MTQELYINGQRADIKDDSLILFTFQQSDYSDPTAVKNSYTKSITLPGTKNNHRIFNEIYRLDYHQNDSVFNPSKRTQFEIYSKGSLLESGYLKLTKITGVGEYREYQISLYGGLGDFMYSLQYDSDGNKLTMADIVSYDYADLDFEINRATVKEAWNYINGDKTLSSNWGSINFAPCYNGIPDSDNFDAKYIAVYCGHGEAPSAGIRIDMVRNDSKMSYLPAVSGDYEPWTDNNNYRWGLIEVDEDMDEWQTEDHRCWMQRPVFSVKFLFTMIEDYLRETVDPKFTIDLDESWFNDNNPYWANLWITLPLLYENKEDVKTGDNITHEILFANTKTPYDYLTSYTKSFGLWYSYNVHTKTVSILPRYKFYNSEIQDINGKIDKKSIKIDPLSFSFRTLKYDWKEAEDDISEAYQKKTEDNYGVYGIDTGWEFDNSSKTVPSSQVMKSAIDIREKSIYYSTLQLVYDDTIDVGSRTYEIMPAFFWNSDISYTIWNKNNTEDTLTYDNLLPSMSASEYAVLTRGYTMDDTLTGELNKDGVSKPKFCDDENKSVDGSDVFLLYAGKDSADRWYKYSGSTKYDIGDNLNYNYISDDIDGFETAIDNKQCWINTTWHTKSSPLPYISNAVFPKFTRMKLNNKSVEWSLDFGKPAQTYVFDDLVYDESNTISRKTFLDKYISDLYSVNTRLVETKMRIEDPKSAMKTVYLFDNSLWVINKLTDFNYEDNLTTVQFIKINDTDNYIVRMPDFYTGTSSDTPINAGGNAGSLTVYLDKSYSDVVNNYAYASDYSWLSGKSGNDGTYPYVEIMWDGNSSFNSRSGYLTMSYGCLFQNIYVKQDGKLIAYPSEIYFDNTDGQGVVAFNTVIDTDTYDFYISTSASWLKAELGSDMRVRVYVDANDSGEDRSATIRFTYNYSTTITIYQSK